MDDWGDLVFCEDRSMAVHALCADCGAVFDCDDCDGDLRGDGSFKMTYGSTLGYECDGCTLWVCNVCKSLHQPACDQGLDPFQPLGVSPFECAA